MVGKKETCHRPHGVLITITKNGEQKKSVIGHEKPPITMDSKDNKEEKTGEGVDIRMYHFSLNFLQLGCDKLW